MEIFSKLHSTPLVAAWTERVRIAFHLYNLSTKIALLNLNDRIRIYNDLKYAFYVI
jgi:hypothetical protein